MESDLTILNLAGSSTGYPLLKKMEYDLTMLNLTGSSNRVPTSEVNGI